MKVYGAKDSALRTADQTQMGIFWAYDVGTIGPPPVLYNQITAVIAHNQQNTLEQNARLFALTNIAQADAGIATWEAKYHHDFWRPIAAIRLADTDGNDATLADPNWEPLGAPGDGIIADFTPPFPAYTSGHAAFGAAVMAMIREFYGTDEIAYHRL
ncbi:MAG: vanadium-dependent haloperoxidase [Betaproteobacteria bacterium]|nr:vanadium-dependent haloperoxidase [Betaproteobacteria bacterium]